MCFFRRKQPNGYPSPKDVAEEAIRIEAELRAAAVEREVEQNRRIAEAADPITDEDPQPPSHTSCPPGPYRIGTTGAGPMLTPLDEAEDQNEGPTP